MNILNNNNEQKILYVRYKKIFFVENKIDFTKLEKCYYINAMFFS